MDYPAPIEGVELVSAEASNDQIQELIGMSFPIFTNTVLFAQHTRGRTVTDFLDEDDAGQKEIFSTLFNLQCYEEALELVKPDLKKTTNELQALRVEIDKLEISFEETQKLLTNLQLKKTEFEILNSVNIKSLEAKLEQVETRLKSSESEVYSKELVHLLTQVQKKEVEVDTAKTDHTASVITLTTLQNKVTDAAGDLERKKSWTFAVPTKPEVPHSLEQIREQRQKLLEELQQLVSKKESIDRQREEFQLKQSATQSKLKQAKQMLETVTRQQTSITKQRAALNEKLQSTICSRCKQEYLTEEAKKAALADIYEELNRLHDVDFKPYNKAIEQAQQEVNTLHSIDEEGYNQLFVFITARRSELTLLDVEESKLQEYDKLVLQTTTKREEMQKEIARLEQELIAQYNLVEPTKSKASLLKEKAEAFSAELTQLRTKLNEVREFVEREILPLQENKQQLQKELDKERQQVFSDAKWLLEAEDKFKALSVSLQEKKQLVGSLEKEALLLDQVVEAFSKEGIVAELFREYMPDIQQRASDYLAELTNNELEITFSAEKQLKKKVAGEIATRAQFSIEVSKKNGGAGYDLISGSEQNKAALVTNWALADLAYAHSNVTCNVRVFDEIFDSLDPKGMERLAQMIITHSLHSNQKTLVITHKQELEDYFEHRIVLQKIAGETNIKEIL